LALLLALHAGLPSHLAVVEAPVDAAVAAAAAAGTAAEMGVDPAAVVGEVLAAPGVLHHPPGLLPLHDPWHARGLFHC